MRRLLLVAMAAAGVAAAGCDGARHGSSDRSAPFVLVSNRGGAWRLYEVDRDGGAARLVGSPRADGPAYEDTQPARLADGSIVFTSDRDGTPALYRCDRGSGTARPLFAADAGTADSDPAPCGSDRIVFARAPFAAAGGGGAAGVAGGRDLFLAARDGGGVRRLTTDPADDGAPCALPDGRTVVFASGRAGRRRLFRLDTAADDPESSVAPLLPAGQAFDDAPACLPDGSILFARAPEAGRFQVFQIRFGEKGPVTRQITEAATLPYGAGEPVPLADGTILLTAGPGPANGGPRYAVYGISGGGYNLARVTRERAGYEDLTRRLSPPR
jgi:Tol biopolymer transport system component